MLFSDEIYTEMIQDAVTDEDYDFPAPNGDSHEYEEYDEPCPVVPHGEDLEVDDREMDYDDPVQRY